MKIKYKKINKDASFTVEGNIASFKCVSIEPEVSEDKRLILSYKSGIELTIEDDIVGIMLMPKNSHLKSLEMAGGPAVITKGTTEVGCMFKTNTDSIPSVFEKDDDFCRIVFIGETNIEFEEIKENEVI